MGFYTGVPLSPKGLLEAVKVAAEAEGFTTNYYAQGSDSNTQNFCTMHTWDGEIRYYNLRAYDSSLTMLLRGSTGYDVGGVDDFALMPGTAIVATQSDYLQTPMKQYWIFATPQYVHVVVERNTNIFTHFGFGVLNKCATYTGGEYCYGTYLGADNPSQYCDPSDPDNTYLCYPFDSNDNYNALERQSHIRADIEDQTDSWYIFGYNEDIKFGGKYARGQTRGGSTTTYLRSRSGPIHYSGQGMLIPNYIYLRNPVNGYYRKAGETADLRVCRTNSFTLKSKFSLGVDDWWVFPVVQQYGGSGHDSYYYGMAYKETP